MSNKPNIAKRSARSVNRRIAEDGQTWPIELYETARECGHALDMVPRQERYMDHRLFSDFVNRSVDRFTTALAEFEGRE